MTNFADWHPYNNYLHQVYLLATFLWNYTLHPKPPEAAPLGLLFFPPITFSNTKHLLMPSSHCEFQQYRQHKPMIHFSACWLGEGSDPCVAVTSQHASCITKYHWWNENIQGGCFPLTPTHFLFCYSSTTLLEKPACAVFLLSKSQSLEQNKKIILQNTRWSVVTVFPAQTRMKDEAIFIVEFLNKPILFATSKSLNFLLLLVF